LLGYAARACPEAVEVLKSANSRANPRAIDTAGIQAKLNSIVETTGSGSKASPVAIDAPCCASPSRAIADSTGPGPCRAENATCGIADAPAYAVGSGADMAGSDNQRQMLPYRACSKANAGARDATAPSNDRRRRGRLLSVRKKCGLANESGRQSQNHSTLHGFLRDAGRPSCFKTAV
jgi:hypothetical protein